MLSCKAARKALVTTHCFVLTDKSREDAFAFETTGATRQPSWAVWDRQRTAQPQVLEGQDPAFIIWQSKAAFVKLFSNTSNKTHFLQGFFKAVSFPGLKSYGKHQDYQGLAAGSGKRRENSSPEALSPTLFLAT